MTKALSQIIQAKSNEEITIAIELFKEYNDFLGFDLDFQAFEKELTEIDQMYGAPKGALFLVKVEDKFVGCAGIRYNEPEVCELKRMFLKTQTRGTGLGQKLMQSCIDEAKNLGYKKMRLDTLPHLKQALGLYQKFGFKPIDAYCFNPFKEAIFLEKAL